MARAGTGRGGTPAAIAASLALVGACYSTDPGPAPGGRVDDGSAGSAAAGGDARTAPTVTQPSVGTMPVAPPLPGGSSTPAPWPMAPQPVSTTPAPVPPAPSSPDPEPVDSEEDAGVETTPGHDLGKPCNPDAPGACQWDACYVPGAVDNPICSKLCADNSDCPEDAECIFPESCGGSQNVCDGLGYCFVRCEDDALCQAINDTPANPLSCVAHPKDGFEGVPVNVCIESSEP